MYHASPSRCSIYFLPFPSSRQKGISANLPFASERKDSIWQEKLHNKKNTLVNFTQCFHADSVSIRLHVSVLISEIMSAHALCSPPSYNDQETVCTYSEDTWIMESIEH